LLLLTTRTAQAAPVFFHDSITSSCPAKNRHGDGLLQSMHPPENLRGKCRSAFPTNFPKVSATLVASIWVGPLSQPADSCSSARQPIIVSAPLIPRLAVN